MLDVMQEADLIRRVARRVYWNSRYTKLRSLIDEEDLIQMVFLKLLHRDNYKIYSDSYSLVGFLYMVANGCAISYSNKKSTKAESVILDQSINDEESLPLIDSLVSEEPNVDCDTQYRINRVAASMDPTIIPKVVIRYNDVDTPFSIESLFDFFMETKYRKKDVHKYIINLTTNSPVTPTTFNKWWNTMLSSAQKELSRM